MTTEQMACVRELADDLDRVVLEVSARDGDATARQYARAGAIRAMLAELDALKAREAKLREALEVVAKAPFYGLAVPPRDAYVLVSDFFGAVSAALAEGEPHA